MANVAHAKSGSTALRATALVTLTDLSAEAACGISGAMKARLRILHVADAYHNRHERPT